MSLSDVKYVVITPVRNEEAYLRYTVESMLAQTVRPQEWVIVNDGSTDATGPIIDTYAGRYPWICAVHRQNRGFRHSGGGVEAFNEGYQTLSFPDWHFIVNLDGDLSFEPDYFEKCFENFQRDPKLGIGGGTIYNLVHGKKALDKTPAFHVRGATKIYKRECWNAIGGVWPAPGWDTMDEVKANMLGWSTLSFSDLSLTHYRFTSSAEGFWRGFVNNGRANYICGYHPLFMMIRCVNRFFRVPYVLGSAGLAYGFITGYLKRVPRVNDPEAIAYLRRQQMRRLMGKQTIWR